MEPKLNSQTPPKKAAMPPPPQQKPAPKGDQTTPKSPPTETPKVEASGDESETDELGYAITPPEGEQKPQAKEPEKKVAAKTETPADEIEPSTGYGAAQDEDDDETPEPPKKETEKDVELGYELKVDPIIPKEESKKIKEFAKKHNMTQEQTQAYFDLRKTEAEAHNLAVQESQKEAQRAVKRLRSDWHNELKNDPTFGGEHFDHNVQRVERVLQDHMPETKKELTKRGSMLPPYVMRDLAKLADILHSTETLNQGEPPAPPEQEEESEENDPLAFYQ